MVAGAGIVGCGSLNWRPGFDYLLELAETVHTLNTEDRHVFKLEHADRSQL